MPLSHFRRLFPQFCQPDGRLTEGVLESSLALFKSYNGGLMKIYGWLTLQTQHIGTMKFHPLRFYVVERVNGRILISHATASWLGLIKVLCNNKAAKCRRQVASINKKVKKLHSHNKCSTFRTTTPSQSEPATKQKMVMKVWRFSQKQNLNFVGRQAFACFKHGFFQVWGKC